MQLFRAVYYFFSRYTDPAERRVGRFFGRVKERHSTRNVEKSLVRLLQQDIAVVNLWTEYRYKGYNYLTKRVRRELYANLALIRADFEAFVAIQQPDTRGVITQISSLGVDTAKLSTFPEQLAHIVLIMQYLSPQAGYYEYRASSSFGRMLRDPTREVLEGDCNQIVTLYLYLYSTKFSVTDLKLTLLPGHVALNFCGVDIEATSGSFVKYQEKGQLSAPVHEIVSVNLLDTTDVNFAKSVVNPETFLQAARLAYIVSSDRKLVENNLGIAYRNTVHYLLEKRQHKAALEYAVQSKDYELIEAVAYSGAVHELNEDHFREARSFAARSSRKHELLRSIDEREAAHLYRAKRYKDALKIYERLRAKEGIHQCYRALYVQAQSELKNARTVADIRAHASVVRDMEHYAHASGDRELVAHAKSLAKYL